MVLLHKVEFNGKAKLGKRVALESSVSIEMGRNLVNQLIHAVVPPPFKFLLHQMSSLLSSRHVPSAPEVPSCKLKNLGPS